MINNEPFMRSVNRGLRVEIFKSHVGHPELLRETLQITVAIGDANRADVIPFRKEQFQDHEAIFAQTLGVGLHLHPLRNHRDAGGQKLGGAGNFD